MRIISTSTWLMTIIISIASCDGNQSSQPTNNTKKDLSVMEQACDTVNDTIYMNFHSNMKINDFTKELENNSNIENGKSTLDFKDYKIPFTITPDYNGCLTTINLDAELQFGTEKSEDKAEEEFIEYLIQTLQNKYGPLILNDQSSYKEPSNKNYYTEHDIKTLKESIGFDREVAISEFNRQGRTWLFDKPKWADLYTYSGCSNALNKNGELYIEYFSGLTKKRRVATPEELETEKMKNIDVLTSASYKSYSNIKKEINIIIVTSHYTHQTYYKGPKINTQRSRIILDYYTERYWRELIKQKEMKQEAKKKEKQLKDSLLNSNHVKL